MSFSRRARVAEAVSNGQPALDVLRLVPPDAYLAVLRRAADAFVSYRASEGMRLFDDLRDPGASPPGLPAALRRVGVSEHVSGLSTP